MLYVLLLIVSILFISIGEFIANRDRYNSHGESMYVWGVVIAIFSFVFAIVSLFSGIFCNVQLVGKRTEVISLKQNIETVREAYYLNDTKNHSKLINGSLDNMAQSTALSNYIKEYATKKADYNRRLAEVQLRKTHALYIWVTDGMFIPRNVLKLKLIEE